MESKNFSFFSLKGLWLVFQAFFSHWIGWALAAGTTLAIVIGFNQLFAGWQMFGLGFVGSAFLLILVGLVILIALAYLFYFGLRILMGVLVLFELGWMIIQAFRPY